MKVTFKFKRGLSKYLPETAPLGEPLFCVDTFNLYIGMGSSAPLRLIGIIDPNDLDLVTDYYSSLHKDWDNVSTTIEDNTVDSGLLPSEEECMDHLVKAFNIFSNLPVQRKHDLPEFVTSMHQLQRLVAIRSMRRAFPKYWVSDNTETLS
jgi:hypothetical protein